MLAFLSSPVFYQTSVLTRSMVAAAALLAEGSEERWNVPQEGAAVLYEEANKLTNLQEETAPGYLM